MVSDFEQFTYEFHAPGHLIKMSCWCAGCVLVQKQDGCLKPSLCVEQAKEMLDLLPSKWDSRGIHPCDYENRTYNEHKAWACDIGEELVPFDKQVTMDGHTGEVFRIFTLGTVNNDQVMADEEPNQGETLTVMTDGSCL